MPTPLSEAFASVLRSDATAALAALMVIANAHQEIFAWTARMLGGEKAVEAKPNGIDLSRERKSTFGQAKQARSAQNTAVKQREPSRNAYHQRRREARGRDDQALIQAMRDSPEGSIGDWTEAISKSRTSTVSALHRLRDAGLAESAEGKWRLVEEPAPREPPAKWVAPVSVREHRAHA
jgi:hypothetical protein